MSAEAVIGTGVTVASIGVLFLLLGWAQSMRQEPAAAFILFAIGAVLLVVGGMAAMFGSSGRRPDAATRAAASDSPTAQGPNDRTV
jgi:membrane protein implicated in regulation of membrane protease activity